MYVVLLSFEVWDLIKMYCQHVLKTELFQALILLVWPARAFFGLKISKK